MNTLRISASIRAFRRELSCPDIILLPELAKVPGVSVGYLPGEGS